MTLLDRLQTLPALFINVDGHEDRAAQFMQNTAPLMREVYRLPAVPVVDAVEEANDFVARVRHSRENSDPQGYFSKLNVYKDGPWDKWSRRAHEYACTRSLTLSQLKAIQAARQLGWDRFMLFEDDAVPRLDLLASTDDYPEDGDIVVWGGAYGGGAIRRDNERYTNLQNPKWQRVEGKNKRFFTQAIELSTAGMDAIEYGIRNHFFAADMCWWYAHDLVPSYTLQPSAFVQKGGSVRAMSHSPSREGIAVR